MLEYSRNTCRYDSVGFVGPRTIYCYISNFLHHEEVASSLSCSKELLARFATEQFIHLEDRGSPLVSPPIEPHGVPDVPIGVCHVDRVELNLDPDWLVPVLNLALNVPLYFTNYNLT